MLMHFIFFPFHLLDSYCPTRLWFTSTPGNVHDEPDFVCCLLHFETGGIKHSTNGPLVLNKHFLTQPWHLYYYHNYHSLLIFIFQNLFIIVTISTHSIQLHIRMSSKAQSTISFFAASSAPSAFSLFAHPLDHRDAYENGRLIWPSAIYMSSKSEIPSHPANDEDEGAFTISSFLMKLNKVLRNKIIAAI